MAGVRRPSTWPGKLALGGAIAAAHVALVSLSVYEPRPLFWPASGLAVGAVYLLGWRYWPAIFSGALIGYSLVFEGPGGSPMLPLWLAAALAGGSVTEALIGAALIRRLGGALPFDSPRGVGGILIGAAVLATLVSASWSATLICLNAGTTDWGPFSSIFLGAWFTTGTAILVLTPLILVWSTTRPLEMTPQRLTSLAGQLVLLVVAGAAAVFDIGPPRVPVDLSMLLPIPVIAWSALTLGARGASSLMAAVVLVWIYGPWGQPAVGGSDPSPLFVQTFICAGSATGLLVAAVSEQYGQATDRLRGARDDLEELVEQRTAQLVELNRGLRAEVEMRQSIEASLRKSQASLARAHQIARIAHWEWSAESGPSGSDELYRLLGFEPEEIDLDTETYWSFIHPEDRDRIRQAYNEAVHKKQRLSERFRMSRRDGSTAWMETSGELISDARGDISGIAGTLQDVTERHLLEQRLHQAEKMQALGRLTGGIAHEFNNLLTAVSGYAELTRDQLEPDHPAAPQLDEIVKASERGAALTAQLLAFGRRRLGEPRLVDLNELLDGVSGMLQRLIGESIQLEPRPGAGLWRIEVDPDDLEEVLANLVVNARDAMPDGGCIQIETLNARLGADEARERGDLDPGAYVILRVSDNGVGIEETTHGYIFEPFYTTKGIGQGPGLGLSTVYGIVEEARGRVRLLSRAGKGTTVEVYLPAAEADALREPSLRLVRERVLLVEDDGPVRRIASRVLESAGYQVLAAEDPAHALMLALNREPPIDLLLSDVVMPQMSGPQLASRIEELHPDVTVLYMTGYSGEELDGALRKHAILRKPFSPAELTRRVRDELERAQASPPGSAASAPDGAVGGAEARE